MENQQKSEDESCACSHAKSEHYNTTAEKGHADCKKCECSKFTWVKPIC